MKYQIEKQVENEVQARLMKERVEREKKLQREVRWEFLFCKAGKRQPIQLSSIFHVLCEYSLQLQI